MVRVEPQPRVREDATVPVHRVHGQHGRLVPRAKTSTSVKVLLHARELEMWSTEQNKYIVEEASYTLSVGQWVADPKMVHKTLHIASS